MGQTVDLVIDWTGDNVDIRWEDWWVRRFGKNRTRIPTYDEYLGFVDYDLGINNLPRLIRRNGKIIIPEVPLDREDLAGEIARDHGFLVSRSA